jgi:hypothetical protein
VLLAPEENKNVRKNEKMNMLNFGHCLQQWQTG